MGNTHSSPSNFEVFAVSVPGDTFFHLNVVKPYNTAYDITPVAVVRPSTTEEVANVVKCAAIYGVKVQVRSGGHSYGDYSIGGEDGAFVIDMVNFQQFSFDESTGYAVVGSGTLLEDARKRRFVFIREVYDSLLSFAKLCSLQVGIGGHATIGTLSRIWGAALDHVIEAEVVLANGTVVRTNKDDHLEVFFAIKGAGASFGVVTEFKVVTHPEPEEVVKYSYTISIGSHKSMAKTFDTWQNIVSQPDLPRKFASQATVLEGMMLRKDATSVSIGVDDWLGTLTNLAETEAVRLLGGVSTSFYSKSLAIRTNTLLSNNTIESLFELFDSPNKGSVVWFVIFDLVGGAPRDETAYPHRDVLAKLGAYAGYVDPRLTDGRERYWRSNYPRLREIKKDLDPEDTFHNPQSVLPWPDLLFVSGGSFP
ncbi:FAD-binding domain-containing protein [Marasmius fiardii PR-910]|nr:FAD-binding domain-containing protein [Marasmius fiardii PR-910]